jgi:hypothetical protein
MFAINPKRWFNSRLCLFEEVIHQHRRGEAPIY